MRFYLGTHQPGWLTRTAVPLFISDVRLSQYRTLPQAQGRWALDSNGFSMLSVHRPWAAGPTPREYVARVRRYAGEVGALDWVAPQDWVCEPFITAKTGLTVYDHQQPTTGNTGVFKPLNSNVVVSAPCAALSMVIWGSPLVVR
ncbi:hypothetical protein [Nocardia sp. NPDC005366]|uniref:deazapurine DNA modification protein DpdA family protein n=1 Tax=Nocardia sp. NPDC005366 TaxID=3156878 RepID=UPI0033B57A06